MRRTAGSARASRLYVLMTMDTVIYVIKAIHEINKINIINPNLGGGGRGVILRHLAAFSNILLETFMPNLVIVLFITHASLQILGKSQAGVFRFPDFWSMPYKRKLS